MSDLFRRASEAFHPRQRQGSADSTEAPEAPDARRPSETELLKQKSEPSQPESHVNEAIAGTANDNVPLPKQRRHWGWPGHHQGKPTETKGQPTQQQKDNDWIIGT
ncbi:hypothetical protein N7513_011239 [Penicillium frequentans]|uniref:Uncharacterized protein n=1 Tax=Penicillium frequentans TaxID=3151616 RepID=A0AAD6CZB3_9EURO|nr:hypothetical protein N7513_011239 [Penicillium glabrum]KAJ5546142.1 hypothetical protein N7494_003727 [Penicillium glabrum]